VCSNTKLVLIGDPHFANRKLFGRPTDKPGVNTRLQYTQQALEWIARDIPADIDHVCILGDITHDHGRLTPPVLLAIQDMLLEFAEHGHSVAMLGGNHDMDGYGLSIVSAFESDSREVREVVTEPRQLYYSFPIPIHAIPYGLMSDALDYMAELTERCIVLMHHSFEGAKHGTHEFQPPGGIPPALIPDHIEVFSGHYHMRQKMNKHVEYTGAPLQHDFGEVNYTPGYVILEIDSGSIRQQFIEVPPEVAPRFHILPHNLELGKIPGLPKRDYYRIDLPTDVDPKEITALRKKLTNVIVKTIPIDSDMRSRVEEHVKTLGKRVQFTDVMEAYVAMNAEEERADRLNDLGLELAEEALK